MYDYVDYTDYKRPHTHAWARDADHTIEQLRYQFDQQRKDAVHFKVVAEDLERNLKNVSDTAKRNLDARNALAEATGGCVPEFQFQEPFTICVLCDPMSERVFTGAAACGKQDTFNAEIGKAISLGRAMNQRAEYFANAAYAK